MSLHFLRWVVSRYKDGGGGVNQKKSLHLDFGAPLKFGGFSNILPILSVFFCGFNGFSTFTTKKGTVVAVDCPKFEVCCQPTSTPHMDMYEVYSQFNFTYFGFIMFFSHVDFKKAIFD